ncbi:MAG: oligosaccharide flippase family protein [Pseudomonadota bacterium]
MTRVSEQPSVAPRSFLKDVVSVLQTKVAVLCLGFVSSILLARYLGAEVRGLLAALLVVPTVVMTLCELGIRQSAAFHIGQDRAQLDRIAGTLVGLGLLTALLALGLSIAYFRLTWLSSYSWSLIALTLMLIPAKIVQSYASGLFLGTQRIADFNKVSWLPALVRAGCILALVAGLQVGLWGALWAEVLAAVAMTTYALWLAASFVHVRLGFDAALAKKLVRLGFVYAASLFAITLLYKINILLLQRLSTLEELGLYTVGANLAEYIWQLPAVMGAIIFSRSANAKNRPDFSQKIFVLLRLTLVLATLGALAVASVVSVFVPLVFGPAFSGSVPVIHALLPGIVGFVVVKILNMDLAGQGKPWVTLSVVVPAVALNLALAFWLIPQFGAIGAAGAISITYLLAALLYVFVYAQATGSAIRDIALYRRSDFDLLKAKARGMLVWKARAS